MAGLKNRIVTVEFPELTEDGDPPLYVSFRNPRLVPLEWLRSNLAVGQDGRPLDQDAATEESYERIARRNSVVLNSWPGRGDCTRPTGTVACRAAPCSCRR